MVKLQGKKDTPQQLLLVKFYMKKLLCRISVAASGSALASAEVECYDALLGLHAVDYFPHVERNPVSVRRDLDKDLLGKSFS